MNDLLQIAAQNREKAFKIVDDLHLVELWQSIGAEVHLVGSLKMGLLMKHKDIDFHVYSAPLLLADSFAVVAKLAQNTAIKRIEYNNLIDTDEKCIEWHVCYLDEGNELWQIDMIHILKG